MAKQYAISDQNQIKAQLLHLGTSDTTDTVRATGQTNGAQNTHITGGTVSTAVANTAYSIAIDTSAAGTAYYGYADPGSSGTAAVWQIKRKVSTGGTQSLFTFADGNSSFDNVWDNRGTYNYS